MKVVLVMCKLVGVLKCFSESVCYLTFRFSLTFKILLTTMKVVVVMHEGMIIGLVFKVFKLLVLTSTLFGVRVSVSTGGFKLGL